jgi:hypothetical protein
MQSTSPTDLRQIQNMLCDADYAVHITLYEWAA